MIEAAPHSGVPTFMIHSSVTVEFEKNNHVTGESFVTKQSTKLARGGTSMKSDQKLTTSESEVLGNIYGQPRMTQIVVSQKSQKLSIEKWKIIKQNEPRHGSSHKRRLNVVFISCILYMLLPRVGAKTIQFSESYAEGTIKPNIEFFVDATYTDKYYQLPQFETSQILYAEISIDGVNDVKLVLVSYWATPTASPDDVTSITLIQDPGCPSGEIPTNIEMNGETNKIRFNHQVFHFNGIPTTTFHYRIQYCVGTCKPNCGSRRRRSTSFDYDVIIMSRTLDVASNSTLLQHQK